MPLTKKAKPLPPPSPPSPAPRPPAPGISREELEAALHARDLVWQARLQAMKAELLAAIPKLPPAAVNKAGPRHVKFEFDLKGEPVGFTINPES